MKSESYGILAFFFLVIGFGLIGISEDVSGNAKIKNDTRRLEGQRVAHILEQQKQFLIEQEMLRVGCVTLDCAIARSMK